MACIAYLDLHTRNGTSIDTRLRLTFAPDKIEKNASIKTSGRFIHIFRTTQKLKFSSYARELYEKRKNGSLRVLIYPMGVGLACYLYLHTR